jgi:hypothetical protein
LNEKKRMDDCSYTHTRYLLEDLRISHVGVSSSSSLFNVLLNIGIHIQGISRDYSFLVIRLPTINLLHCRSNEPCRHYQQRRR